MSLKVEMISPATARMSCDFLSYGSRLTFSTLTTETA